MAVQKYRKRPIEVEAIQIMAPTAQDIMDWTDPDVITVKEDGKGNVFVEIITSTGSHLATNGDWLIKGIDGNFYAMTNDTFQKLYEMA